jgi:hypothetical protein
MRETPGVIASGAEQLANSLAIDAKVYDVPQVTRGHFATLRNLSETPDGYAFADPLAARRLARQLAIGLHYIWDPRPPEEWLAARKAWASWCRRYIAATDDADTEGQVKSLLDKGDVDNPATRAGALLLADWREVEPTFVPNPKPVWHTDAQLQLAAAWLEKEKGIVWCEHRFFAERLAELTGRPYYGQDAKTKAGQHIRDAKGPIIASIKSCGTGHNLQSWHKNLLVDPMAGGDIMEQLLGRTHRQGQKADTVYMTVLWGCAEHAQAAWRARRAAEMIQDTTGTAQRLCYADINYPREDDFVHLGPQWDKEAQALEPGAETDWDDESEDD